LIFYFRITRDDLVAGFFKRTFNHAVGKTVSLVFHGMSNRIATL
jgi:hypothetical protein